MGNRNYTQPAGLLAGSKQHLMWFILHEALAEVAIVPVREE